MEHLELPFFLVRVLRAHARRPAQAGRFDEADRLQKEMLALGREAGLGYVATVASHVSALVDMDRGPRPETLEHLERAAKERSGFRLPQAVLAELLLAAGRADEAQAHVADIGRGGFGEVPRNISWLATFRCAAMWRRSPETKMPAPCCTTSCIRSLVAWAGPVSPSTRLIWCSGALQRPLANLASRCVTWSRPRAWPDAWAQPHTSPVLGCTELP